MARIHLGRKWKDFFALTKSLRRYPEISARPVVFYALLRDLRAFFVEFNPRPFYVLPFRAT